MGSKKVVEQSWAEQSENIFVFSSYIRLSSLVKWLYMYMICVCISICISNCIFISNVFVFVCCHICLVWPTGCPRSSSPAEPPASCLLGQEGRQGKAGGRQTLFFPRPGIIHHNILQTLVFSQYNNTTHPLFLYKQSCIAIFYKRARWGGVTEHVCPSLGKTPPLPHKSVGQGDFNISASTCITSNSTS